MKYKFIPTILKDKAYSLKHLGLDSIAWEKGDAIMIINLLANKDIPVLGGDIFNMQNGQLETTYMNWYFNRDEVEGWTEYIIEAKDRAINYIEGVNCDKDIYIDIVTP